CSSFSPNFTKVCNAKDSFILLHLKNEYPVGKPAVHEEECRRTAYPKTETWKQGTDCCLWDGVDCDELTGNVIGLDLSCSGLRGTILPNSSLFHLLHLQKLNLAYNYFSHSPFPSEFGLLANLMELNLSRCPFLGQVPPELSHLSKLVSLDITHSSHLKFDNIGFQRLGQNLTALKILHLHMVDMPLVAPLVLHNLSSSLRSPRLQNCRMKGKLHSDFSQFPSLEILDLSINPFLEGNFPDFNRSSPLRLLSLRYANFSGELPDSIGNLKCLEYLDLSLNHFSGSIPTSLGNLGQLKLLQLASNKFTGHIFDDFGNLSRLSKLTLHSNSLSGQLPFSLFNLPQLSHLSLLFNQLVGPLPQNVSGLSKLQYLGLGFNKLEGKIPCWLFRLPSLRTLHLSYNRLFGTIEQCQQPNSKLMEVYLQNNEIQGPLPGSIFELVNFTVLNLSFNKLGGTVDWNMLGKLKNLEKLDLSRNSELSFRNAKKASFVLPKLRSLLLSSCNMHEFPKFSGAFESLRYLDLSNNRIHGWISEEDSQGLQSLHHLNLSGNFLTGIEQHPWRNIYTLDLSYNLMEGQLLSPPPHVTVFIISRNKISGRIPSSFCNPSHLSILDISYNYLSGMVPQCLVNSSISLKVLDLRDNDLQGGIPKASSMELVYLDLDGNQLEGPIPESLRSCRNLEVLDLGNNKLKGTFPHWLEALPELRVLVLGSNRLHGTIGRPQTASPFPMLQILDLAHNEFTGFLPSEYLQKMESFLQVDKGDVKPRYLGEMNYYQAFLVKIKGVETKHKTQKKYNIKATPPFSLTIFSRTK
ncbi:hypothetical protein Tsubulata_010223, partial [Turnera subulata]